MKLNYNTSFAIAKGEVQDLKKKQNKTKYAYLPFFSVFQVESLISL